MSRFKKKQKKDDYLLTYCDLNEGTTSLLDLTGVRSEREYSGSIRLSTRDEYTGVKFIAKCYVHRRPESCNSRRRFSGRAPGNLATP